MNISTTCGIVFILVFMSSDWQPWRKVLVEAGRVIYGNKECWHHICYPNPCPEQCECPNPLLRLLGVKNCR
uniref:Putative secreted salivary protein n=1 Tax=Rhipicephalus pulchellus TaxID=72859 RepID=L7M3Q3_RHIPC